MTNSKYNGKSTGYEPTRNVDTLTERDARIYEECHGGYEPVGFSRARQRCIEILVKRNKSRELRNRGRR